MVMVSACSCEVTVGGKPYATIEFAGEYNSDQRLVWASDQRLGARVVDGPSFICCGAYTVGLSAAISPTTKSQGVMTVDSDPCIPVCPACLICSFNLGAFASWAAEIRLRGSTCCFFTRLRRWTRSRWSPLGAGGEHFAPRQTASRTQRGGGEEHKK